MNDNTRPDSTPGPPRRLEDMSLAELWQLFPIILREHDPRYATWYAAERAALAALWGDAAFRISHIGSTAVPGLIAKPTVDILLELDPAVGKQTAMSRIREAGWLLMSEKNMTFNKGYTPAGFAEKVFHLHVRPPGDWDELYFRDYLAAHPDAACEYERLKLELGAVYEHDRDAYTAAKGDFIRQATARARGEFAGRHAPAGLH